MKKNLLIIVFVFGINLMLLAQGQFREGNMEIGGDIYEVFFSEKSIGMLNLSKNTKDIPLPSRGGYLDGVLPVEEKDKHADTALAKSIVMDVLKDKRVILRENKDFVRVNYVFYQNGDVMNINFSLPKHTLITPTEIARIDQRLRKEMKAWFTGRDYKEYPAIHYNKQKRIYF